MLSLLRSPFFQKNLAVDPVFSGLDSLFDGVLRFDNSARSFQPYYSIRTIENGHEIEVETPGFDKTSLNIETHGSRLVIKGERVGEKTYENSSRSFELSFRLSPTIDCDKLSASYKDGILRVLLPQGQTEQKRQIPVT